MALKASKDEDKKKNKNFSYTKLIDSVYQQYFNDIHEDIIHENVIHEKIIPENVIHENIIHEDLDEPVTGPELERIKSIAKLYNMTLQEAKDYMETGEIPQQIKERETKDLVNNVDGMINDLKNKGFITDRKFLDGYKNLTKGEMALGLGSLGAAGLGGALITNQVNKRKKDKNFSYTDLIDDVYEQYFNKGN